MANVLDKNPGLSPQQYALRQQMAIAQNRIDAQPQPQSPQQSVVTPSTGVTPGPGIIEPAAPTVPTSSQATKPQNYTGSTTVYGPVNSEQQKLIDQMNANSIAWYDAGSQAEKDALKAANQDLANQLNTLGVVMSYDKSGRWTGGVRAEESSGSNDFDISRLQSLLQQQMQAAGQQVTGRIDHATEQAIDELKRAQEDASVQYQTMRDQVATDEARGLDRSALYSELRGDKGGIGQAEYNAVQATAAKNRLTVNQAQTKLATDTNRQIADLRARGEFEKADALLGLTQSYLANLVQLEQWAAEYNLSADQFQESINQWNANYQLQVAQLTGTYAGSPTLAAKQWGAEYALSEAQLTGTYNGRPTYAAQQTAQQQLAAAGSALLEAGVMPSIEQLKAMNISEAQATEYINAIKLEKTAKASGSGSGWAGGSGSGGAGGGDLFTDMTNSSNPYLYLSQNYKTYGIPAGQIDNIYNEYLASIGEGPASDYTKDPLYSAAKNIWSDAYTTPDDVIAFLEGKGASQDRVNGILRALGIAAPGDNLSLDSVTNQHGDSWVLVPGFGRLSWNELLSMVESGRIIEKISNGKVTYKKS